MTDERVKTYLNDCIGYRDSVAKIAILSKRGFYIDVSEEGELSLNNFSDKRDYSDIINYLDKDIDEIMEKLFAQDSIVANEVCYSDNDKWKQLFGSNTLYGNKVPTLYLEPFIARLVHSISLCGMHTYYSCDGWHREKRKSQVAIVKFKERYSSIWFETLLRCEELLKCIPISYRVCDDITIEFPLTIADRFESYKALDHIAYILYQNREWFREQKSRLKTDLSGKRKTGVPRIVLLDLFMESYNSNTGIVGKMVSYFEPNKWNTITEDAVQRFVDNCRRY